MDSNGKVLTENNKKHCILACLTVLCVLMNGFCLLIESVCVLMNGFCLLIESVE